MQVCGLKPAQKYLYRVCAENAAGVSDPAEQLGPLLADDPHGTQNTRSVIIVIDMAVLWIFRISMYYTGTWLIEHRYTVIYIVCSMKRESHYFNEKTILNKCSLSSGSYLGPECLQKWTGGDRSPAPHHPCAYLWIPHPHCQVDLWRQGAHFCR